MPPVYEGCSRSIRRDFFPRMLIKHGRCAVGGGWRVPSCPYVDFFPASSYGRWSVYDGVGDLVAFHHVEKGELIGQGIDETGECTVCYLYLQKIYDIYRILI